MNHSNDIEIRKALHQQKLKNYHESDNAIVVDELGLAHGKNRIDIAVLNGCLHGYEIKSSKDSLSRFNDQLRIYRGCLEKLTLVVAPNHVDEVLSITPDWCGILLAAKGERGGIRFTTLRRSYKNPEIDAVAFSHLLWKKEAITILERLGMDDNTRRLSRVELYKQLTKLVSISELSRLIKEQLMMRETWRVAPQLSRGDGSPLLASR